MQEKLLLVIGIILILFGSAGIAGTCIAYTKIEARMAEIPEDLQILTSGAQGIIKNSSETVKSAGVSLLTVSKSLKNASLTLLEIGSYLRSAADEMNQPVALQFRKMASEFDKAAVEIEQTASRFGSTAAYARNVGNYMLSMGTRVSNISSKVSEQMDSLFLLTLFLFLWMGALHLVILLAGVSIIFIRYRIIREREPKK
jgi:fructose-specific phosphotransferase system component IIB